MKGHFYFWLSITFVCALAMHCYAASGPVVAITSPTNSATFLNDQSIAVVAQAQSSSGVINQIDFYDGDTILGTAASPNGTITLISPAPKVYQLRAVATDNAGLSATSAPVRITVLRKVWDLNFPETGSPTLGPDGSIYLGSSDSMTALRADGTLKWKFQTNAITTSIPSVGSDGTVYVAMGDRNLYALNTNGVSKWRFAAGGDMYSCAALANDGTIYIGASDSKLYAIRTNGVKKWTFTADFGSPTAPAIAGDGTVYFTSDTKLYALLPTGKLKWSFELVLGKGSISTAAVIGSDGTIYFGTTGKQLYAISPDGTNRWAFSSSVAFNQTSPIIGRDGTIYCSAANSMFAILPNGQKKWQSTIGSQINGVPLLAADGSLYFCGYERQFICLDSQGELNWALDTSLRMSGTPVMSPDGILVISLGDGLIALGTGSGPDSGPWPMFHQNAQRRGQALATPQITAVIPTGRTNYVAGDPISMSVEGSSPNGVLTRAEFYSDGSLVGIATTQPFEFAWTNAPIGIHQVFAKIIDVGGASVSSNPVRVDVAAPGTIPQILTQPVGQETTNTAKVILAADGFGTMPIVYQWFKDGIAITNSNNNSLVLTNVSLLDSASYYVTLSNSAGSVTSAPVVISVLQPYEIKWSAEILDARGSPAIAQGTHILIPDHNGVTARGPSGQFLWLYRTPDYVWSSPAIGQDGDVTFAVYNGDLDSITPDGDRSWSLTNAGWQGSVAIATDGSIFSTAGTNVFSFDTNGFTNWTFALPYPSSSSPVIDTNGDIYVATEEVYISARTNYSAYFVAVKPDGSEKWRRELTRGFANSAAITAEGLVIVGCLDTNVYALNPANGSNVWKLSVEGPVFGSAAIAEDNTIYITSDAPREGAITPSILHAISPDGHVKWTFKTRGRAANSPAISRDGTIYFGSEDAYFYAINPNGTLKWKIPNYSVVAASPVIGYDGTIYYSTTGEFKAISGTSPLAHSSWPMFRHDVRHTGNAGVIGNDDTFFYPFSSNNFDDMVSVIKRNGEELYVGGFFKIAGGVPANHIAKWDGNQWLPLGSGLDAEVLSIAIDGTNVYAGGAFTHAGGTAANYIARWDGSSWHPLGSGMDDRVYDLEVHDGQLYAAGGFAHAGGLAINAVATWDGSNWSPVGAGLQNGLIFDLLVDGSDLYASAFGQLGTIANPISSVIKWDGAQWSSVGSIFGDCRALAKYNGALYVGGANLQSSGTNVGNLARWQNGAWAKVAAIDFAGLSALNSTGDSLYVGGPFQTIAGTNINRIARYDGTNWFPLGKGVSGSLPTYACSINAIDVHNNEIFAGGAFTSADGKRNVYNFARWNGQEWSSYGPLLQFLNGIFKLTLTDALGKSYGIEASEDLISWTRVATFNDQASASQYIDENAGKTPHKFYRAVTK